MTAGKRRRGRGPTGADRPAPSYAVRESLDAVRDAHGLARRAGSVYAETSSILSSRRAFGDVEEVLVQGWEGVADEVDQALERRVEPG
jgi:hypothetical protein